jgi:hypothetical protein
MANDDLALLPIGVDLVREDLGANKSAKTEQASSKLTWCFLWLALAFRGSHSKTSAIGRICLYASASKNCAILRNF